MAILILKHNALTPYADLQGAKAGIIEKMASAQQGEIWAAEYFTPSSEGVEEIKGVLLAFKGKNGIVTFTDAANISAEFNQALASYYTKNEIDDMFNTKLADYYTKDEVDVALESKADKEYVDAALGGVADAAISVVGGDGIVVSGEGTEKTISTNVELEIKTIEGKEMIQLLDATDNSKVLAEVDASKFVVDGMLDSASIVTINDETELTEGVELPNGKYIKLTWNTDAVKTDTYISVADLISEHKVVAGVDVAGEFVVVTTNVVESTDENGVKVSTVNVTVDDTAIQTTLNTKADKTEVESSLALKADKTEVDQKIGKNDAMLYGTREPASTRWYVVSNWEGEDPDGKQPMPYVIGENWKIETDGIGAPLMLCDSDGNLICDLPTQILSPDGDPYGVNFHIMTHDNGSLEISSVAMDVADQKTQLEIDPNKAYILKLKTSDESHRVTVGVEGDVITQLYNTQESLNYLNTNKADKTEVESSLALKANKTEVESSLALKANKTEVESAISGINAALDTKIGKEDDMLTVSAEPTTNTTTYSGREYFTTSLFNGTNWTVECTLNHDEDLINFVLLDQEEVFSNTFGDFSKKLILTNVNGTLTINKDEQISTITIDPSKSYKLYTLDMNVHPSSHVDVTITQGGDTILNTQESLNYLNENKADKSDIDALDFGVKELLLGERDLGDTVVFHNSEFFQQGSSLDGSAPLEPGCVYFDTISEFDTADGTYEKKLIGRVAGFDNKLGKFDTVLSVNDGETNTDYNVEGALDYLKSEIEAMNVIDCGEY